MPLFGSRTDVTVDVDRAQIVAGESVRVAADVAELDRKVQGARLELGYRNTYEEDTTDADGDRRTTTSVADVLVATEHLELGGGALSPGRLEAAFTVPPDAPGSAADAVEWFARAVVDRRRGRDATATVPLTVLVPADPLAAWAATPPQTSGACAMQLAASARVLRPGDTITGTLTLTPGQAITARAVRVQLRRVREDPDHNRDIDDGTRVEVCGPAELAPDTTRSFDFAIAVPPDAPPSFRAEHNHQHWYVEGVVDVRRAADPTVRAEIVVHTA